METTIFSLIMKTGARRKKQEFREKIINYCEAQEAKDEPAHIPTLSRLLEGKDCEKFIREM